MSNGGWFAYGPSISGSLDQDVEAFFRGQPHPNEIPICIGGGVALSATETHAVWVGTAVIHSTGVSLSVHTALREPSETARRTHPGDGFFGVEFSDESAISSQSWDSEPGMRSQGSGGNAEDWVAHYFLYPIPPDGLTRFHFIAPTLGIPECSAEFDIIG